MLRKFINTLYPIRKSLWQRASFAAACENGNETKFQQNCTTKEQKMTETLRRALPGITYINVEDISGGCGAMYEINIEAKEFNGLSRVKQHQLVTDTLKVEIAEMHGIRIHTNKPTGDE